MRLSNKFYKTSQHWLAAGIFVESRVGAAIVARVGCVDKYHQREYYTHRVQCDCECVQQQQVRAHDIRIFAERAAGI